jgi:hypothetical protein
VGWVVAEAQPRRRRKPDSSALRIQYEDSAYDIDLSDISFSEIRSIRIASGLTFEEMAQASAMLAPEFLAGLVWLHARKTRPTLEYSAVLDSMTLATQWEVVVPDPPDRAGS